MSNYFLIIHFSRPRDRKTQPLPEKKTRKRIIDSDTSTSDDNERPGTSQKRANESGTSNAEENPKSMDDMEQEPEAHSSHVGKTRRRIIQSDTSTADENTDNDDHERPGTSRKRANSTKKSRTSNADVGETQRGTDDENDTHNEDSSDESQSDWYPIIIFFFRISLSLSFPI